MADFRLRLYRRHQRHTSPGTLVGSFTTDAEDSAGAIARFTSDRAGQIAACDYAIITGPFGRIVWEHGSRRD